MEVNIIPESGAYQMIERIPRMSDEQIRELAREVEQRSLLPLEAARLIMRQELEDGQPPHLLIGGAVSQEHRKPGIALTAIDFYNGSGSHWRPVSENARGGTLPVVRATADPITGLWTTLGDYNIAQQRSIIGGIGPNRTYDRGVYGFYYDESKKQYTRIIHAQILASMRDNPDLPMGPIDVIGNDGSFRPFMSPGEYVSDSKTGHPTLATLHGTTAGMLLDIMGDPLILTYPPLSQE